MRKTLLLAGILLALAGCGSKTGTESSATPPPSTAGSSTASTGTTARPDQPVDPVLGPDGFGGYKLGATPAAMQAAGLVVTAVKTDPTCPQASSIQRPDGRFALVFYSAKHGLSAIEAKGDMHTPEGIKIDSTLAAVQKAYPKLHSVLGDPHFNGENLAPVPGNAAARYRIFVVAGTVTHLHLILAGNDCAV